MDDMLSTQPIAELTAEDEMTVEQMFAEMRRLNEIMRRDQAEIEKLRAENEALKFETQRLSARTDAAFIRLREVMHRC